MTFLINILIIAIWKSRQAFRTYGWGNMPLRADKLTLPHNNVVLQLNILDSWFRIYLQLDFISLEMNSPKYFGGEHTILTCESSTGLSCVETAKLLKIPSFLDTPDAARCSTSGTSRSANKPSSLSFNSSGIFPLHADRETVAVCFWATVATISRLNTTD